jgi:predicted secreted protein
MDIVSSIVVYILLWWWVFFMVLPFGARPAEKQIPGQASSAPEKPRIVTKMLITSVIAAGLFFIVHAVITSGIFSFRELAG